MKNRTINNKNRTSVFRELSKLISVLTIVGLCSGVASAKTYSSVIPEVSCKEIVQSVAECRESQASLLKTSIDSKEVSAACADLQKHADFCTQGVSASCTEEKINFEECREYQAKRLGASVDSKEVAHACSNSQGFYDACESDSQGSTTCASEKQYLDNCIRTEKSGQCGAYQQVYDWCVGDSRCPKEKASAEQCLAANAKSITPNKACVKQLQSYDSCIGKKPASCVKLDRAYNDCKAVYGDKSCGKQQASSYSCYDNY